jgi:hypothetical protein
LAVIAALLWPPLSAVGGEDDFWCYDTFDSYRSIKYWATAHVSVSDYKYNSGDASALRLIKRGAGKTIAELPTDGIFTHFRNEFARLIKGNLPFHDAEEGRSDRVKRLLEKYRNAPVLFDQIQAHEEAYRNSMFGSNPGGVFCLIKIARHDFPVLYESKCSLVANKDLFNRGGLESSNLGFSTPDLIESEIKRSITEQLEELGQQLRSIRSCK